jgi:type III pantothenate kinase
MSAPRLIAVDIGNSSTKLGWFGAAASGLPVAEEVHAFPTGISPPAEVVASLPPQPCAWHVSSVHRDGTRILKTFLAAQRPGDQIQLLTHRDLPIRTAVEFPEKVGLDRLAAAVAVNVLREPSRAAILVGAGSAITVNRISAEGVFEGGAIMPGFKMQADALFGADLLPLALLAPDDEPPAPLGKNTEAAIKSGLFWGAVGAVRELVRQMSAGLPSAQPAESSTAPQIFVTGGDLRHLAANLGQDARFVPNLVLSGIAVAAPLIP